MVGPEFTILVGAGAEAILPAAGELAGRLRRATGFAVTVVRASAGEPPDGCLLLGLSSQVAAANESYRMDVNSRGAEITSGSPEGLFRGLQTFRQVLPAEIESGQPLNGPVPVPCLRIIDRPRFAWRGFMLDCGRHFMPKDKLKDVLDLLALYKFNRFHWHLTEDQGWRLEIRKYPRLTKTGAWRGSGRERHGGFYTQDDVRDIVAYAKARFIEVVPEIEMPGHCVAALASYPGLSCGGVPLKVSTEWGIHDDVFCAGKEETFKFIEGVLDEATGLFPFPYFHVGGDEVPRVRWNDCPDCQARIKAEGLAGADALQGWFIGRVAKMLAARGKRTICWDEALDSGPPPGVVIQVWRASMNAVSRAALAGLDVIHSPYSHAYLSYGIAGYWMDLKWVHGWEPAMEGDPPRKVDSRLLKDHLTGGEACLWTEGVESGDVEAMIIPRLLAIAEDLWSSPAGKEWREFERRVADHRGRLEAAGACVGPSVYEEVQH